MEGYNHGGDIYTNTGICLDFSVNTNPFGLPNEIRESLISRLDEFAHYPDPYCRELCKSISLYEEVPLDWILCGNGAADLIYRICYATKPKKALVCAPTFSEYEAALKQVNCEILYHNLTAQNQFNITENILKNITADIDIIFLCNPNNPTGRLMQRDIIHKIIIKAKENNIILVMDECFLDFTNGLSVKNYLIDMTMLIIIKAFTKMYAMAGLRLGYLLMSNNILLEKIRLTTQCWSVSVPAQIAGITAISLKHWREKTRKMMEEERKFLSDELTKLNIIVFYSDANFLLLYSKIELYNSLLQKGILIRSCINYNELCQSYYRIGIKTRSDNMMLIEKIKEILYD